MDYPAFKQGSVGCIVVVITRRRPGLKINFENEWETWVFTPTVEFWVRRF